MDPQRYTSTTRRGFLAAAAAGMAAGAWASAAAAKGLSAAEYVEERYAAGDFGGAQLVIAEKGNVLHSQSWGSCANMDQKKIPFDGNVAFPFFSFSKIVFATIMAMAVERGLLSYDAKVVDYIPDFAAHGKDVITIRQLMTHSAGIPTAAVTGVLTGEGWRNSVQMLCQAELEWAPGSRCFYHGLSASLAGAECLLRQKPGASWNGLCQEWLFAPLGMTHTTYDPRSLEIPVARNGTHVKTLSETEILLGHPGGGCFGTIGDAMKLLNCLANGGAPLLGEAAVTRMRSVAYHEEMTLAESKGESPPWQSWGLGPLVRGTFGADAGLIWFGMGDLTNPDIFGHAGIDTTLGLVDPKSKRAMFFALADSLNEDPKVIALRNGVSSRVFA